MTDNKKFLIISLITNLSYDIIGLVFMLIDHLDTVSIILFTVIILNSIVSSVLTWKIMYNQNRGK